ncbi:hypothetical protein COBT_001330 [Conglomerata obtusa]
MIFFLLCVRCAFYFIRQYKTDTFISSAVSNYIPPTLTTFEGAGAFECKKTKKNMELMEIKLLDSSQNLVFDMAGNGSRLIYYRYHGLKNQNFKLIAINCSGVFAISNKDKCLAYNKEYEDFRLQVCSQDDPTQQFEFLEVGKYNGESSSSGSGGGGSGGNGSGGSGSGGSGSVGSGSGGGGSGGGGSGGEGNSLNPILGPMYDMLKDMHGVIFGSASLFNNPYGLNSYLTRFRSARPNPASLAASQYNVQNILAELTVICHMM